MVTNLFAGLMASGTPDIFALGDAEEQVAGISAGSVFMTALVFVLSIGLSLGAIYLFSRWRIISGVVPARWFLPIGVGVALTLVAFVLYAFTPDVLAGDIPYVHQLVNPSDVQPAWLLAFFVLSFLTIVAVVAKLRSLRVPLLIWLALLWPAGVMLYSLLGGSGLSGLRLFEQIGPVQLSPAYANAVAEYRNGSSGVPEATVGSLVDHIGQLSNDGSGQGRVSLEAIRNSGATVTLLENGGAIVRRDGLSWWVPGTTARQASTLERTPVFEVEGASQVSYLRTATGDLYENGSWVQRDPLTITSNAPSSNLRDLVRSTISGPSEEIRKLPGWRINSTLLSGSDRLINDESTSKLSIRPRASRYIPPGVVPISIHLESTSESGEFKPFSATFSSDSPATEYSWVSITGEFTRQELVEAVPASDSTYTQIPEDLPSRINQLAREITAGIATPYEKAVAIEIYLSNKYAYSFAGPLPRNRVPVNRDPVDWFLFDRQSGTSGNFSSAFVLLARSIGIPARVVSGWAVGRMDENQTVFSDQAHQWAEVAFEYLGWVTFDPTPQAGVFSRAPIGKSVATDQQQLTESSESDARRVTGADSERLVLELGDSDPVVRRNAAVALANSDYPEAVGHLIRRTLFDEDARVRQAASEELFGLVIENPNALERLVETALFDDDRTVRMTALDVLLEGLNDTDVEVRKAAAGALGELGEVRAITLLMQSALFDADADVRKSAAESLGKLDSHGVVRLLGERLTDRDSAVRILVAQALGNLGDLTAIDPLLRAALYDEDAGVRQAAALALGSLKHSRALDLIVDELTNDDPRVRAAAAEALGHLGDLPHLVRWLQTMLFGSALYDFDVGVRRAAVGALSRLDHAEAMTMLLEALRSDSWSTRIAAAEALGFLGDHGALTPLLEMALFDEQQAARRAAVDALRAIAPTKALEGLQDALDNASASVRKAAIEALSYLGDPSAAASMLEILLYDDFPDVRQAAADALRALDPAQALARLLKFLGDDSPSVRQAASRALGHLGDPAAVDALGRALFFDTDAEVREAAARALGMLSHDGVLAFLLEALRDIDPRVQKASAQVLGELADRRAIAPLIDVALFDDDQGVRQAAAEALGRLEVARRGAISRLVETALSANNPLVVVQAVEVLAWLLDHPDSRVLQATLEALGELGHSAAIAPLIEMYLSHDDPVVRGAAGQALVALAGAGPHAFRSLVEAAHSTEDPSVRALVADLLVSALHDEDPFVRRAAAEALGLLEEPAGLIPLGAAARSDVDAGVRQAAAGALGKLKHQRSLELLLEVLDDFDPGVRKAAVEALADLGFVEAVPPLLQVALFDADEEVRQVAIQVLRHLDPEGALEFLLASLVNPEPYIRTSAIDALVSFGGPEIFERLLGTALTDESPVVRQKAVEALNELGPGRALAALLEALKDADLNTRTAAVEALGSLGNPEAFGPLLKVALSDDDVELRQKAIDVLAALNADWTRDALIAAIADADPATRRAAAESFSHLGPSGVGVIKALLAAVADTDPLVRQAALTALEPLGNAVLLESGGALVPIGGEYVMVQGTSARQAAEHTSLPVMRVDGAGHTSYLRIATGDAYDNGHWVPIDPVSVPFDDYDFIPGLLRALTDGPDEAFGALPSERRNLSLLVGYETTPRFAVNDSISVSSIDYRFVPELAAPSSLHLRDVSQSGMLRPFSSTISLDTERRGYTWSSSVPTFTLSQLTQARVVSDPTYTQLPNDLPERIHRLAVQITDRHRSPYAKAKAIEAYLSAEYTYAYADPSDGSPLPPDSDPVDWFLFDHQEGTCGNFSSAFVLLARSIGIPARVVSGWAITPTDQQQTVNSDQAHQWAEVPFEGLGWITFDPTPSEGPQSRTEVFEEVETAEGQGSTGGPDDSAGSGSSGGLVETLLTGDDPGVRAEAARSLGISGGGGALGALVLALGDSNVEVRAEAAGALGQLGDGDAIGALAAALSDTDASVRAEAASALESLGALVTSLESGGSLVVDQDLGYWLPGTTTGQAAGLPSNPIFEVQGAAHTAYLRTAVGDIYENGGWRQLDPAAMHYDTQSAVPEIVTSAIRQRSGSFSSLPQNRLDLALLTQFETAPDTTYVDSIRVAALESVRHIPAGTVPTSPQLQTISTQGTLLPFSKTFVSNDFVPSYTWTSVIPHFAEQQLAGASPSTDSTYTQLPDDLPPRIAELAVEITEGHFGPFEKARAIATYLVNNYGYRFADSQSDFPPPGRDPVDWFLFDHREGTCGVFSSAFVVLARSVGIPARVVSGWAIGPTAETQTVYTDQGHQWAEVAFAGLGWVEFEPTPPGGAPTRARTRSRTAVYGETGSVGVLGGGTGGSGTISIGVGGGDGTGGNGGGSLSAIGGPGAGSNGGERQPPPPPILVPYDTVVEITEWPTEARKGLPFTIAGTLLTTSGGLVGGLDVEIFINENKEQGGTRVGFGRADQGRFEIVISVPKEFEGGNYQLIAHAIGNSSYNESWSDPEITIYSGTEFELTGPSQWPVDTEAVFSGRLFDESGIAVGGYSVDIKIDDIGLPSRSTDAQGVFEFTTIFNEPGFHLIEVSFEESEFLLGNVARLPVEVTMPTRMTLDVPRQVGIGDEFLIEGVLSDSRGDPLGDREVLLTVGELFSDVIRTDEQGVFGSAYVLDDPGDYTVTADFKGTGSILFSSVQGKVAARSIPDLTFWGPQKLGVGAIGTFAGAIVSNDGSPVADAALSVDATGSDQATTVTSDANGAFEFKRSFDRTGTVTLVVNFQGDDWLPASGSVTVAVVQHTSLTLSGAKTAVLGQPYSLEGVLRSTSGDPIQEGSVAVEVDGRFAANLDTGSNGVFTWNTTFSQPSEPTISVRFPGTETLDPAQAILNLTVGAPLVDVEPPEPVVRGDTLTLRGVVAIGDRLIPNTEILVPGQDPVQTNPAGSFVVRLPIATDAESGTSELELSVPSLNTTARVPITIEVPTELEVSVPGSVAVGEDFLVTGKLTDDRGQPLEGMAIDLTVGEFQHGVLVTDQQGNFEATHRADRPGELLAEVEFIGIGPSLPSRAKASIRVQYGTDLLLRGPSQIEIGSTVVISGKLVSAAGAPIASAVVHIDDAAGRRITSVSPDDGGAFEFTHSFNETGLVALTASIASEGTWSPSSASLTVKVVTPTDIEIHGPKAAELDKPYRLEGFLKDSDGAPLSGEPVTIEIAGKPQFTLNTGVDGAFSHEMTFDTAGDVVVSAGFEGTDRLDSAGATLRVFAGVPSLVVETPDPVARGESLTIRGSVTLGSQVIPHAGINVDGEQVTQSSLAGTFVIHRPIAPDARQGSFEIELAAPDLNTITRVPIRVKSSTEILLFPLEDVELGSPLLLQAQLLDDRGEGIPNAVLRIAGTTPITTDATGVASATLQLPLEVDSTVIPVKVTFDGDDIHFPSTYSIHLPIPDDPFNWWLWVGLPLALITGFVMAFLVGRRTSPGRSLAVESGQIATAIATRPVPAEVQQAADAELSQDAPEPEEAIPIKEPVPTEVEIAFATPADDLPNVWEVGEQVRVICSLTDTDGQGIAGRKLHLTLPGTETSLELVSEHDGRCTASTSADTIGEFEVSIDFSGVDDEFLPSSAHATYRVVDFRAEIVRLYNVFLEWAGEKVTGLTDQSTPREAEVLVVRSGVPVDERALEEVIARFEEADYSEHEIGRRQYEAMYRAWSTVVGERTNR